MTNLIKKGNGINFDGTISVGDISKRSGPASLGKDLGYSGASDINIGGITAGEVFTNQTDNEMWDTLMHPFVGPHYSNFIITPGSGLFEFPLTPITSLSATATSIKGTNNIATVSMHRTINGGSDTVVDTHAGIAGGGGESFVDGPVPAIPNPHAAIVGQTCLHSWYLTITDTSVPPVSGSSSALGRRYVYPFLSGVHADGLVVGTNGNALYTDASMTHTLLYPVAGSIHEYDFVPNNNRIYFAYPSSYPALTHAVDIDLSIDYLHAPSNFNMSIVTVIMNMLGGGDSTTQSYRVYEFNHNAGDGSTMFRINFQF